MRKVLWMCAFAVAGCSALSNPVMDPATGEPQVRPDGSEVTVYDKVTETGGSLLAILGGNPLWATLVGAAAALGRDKVVKK